MISHSGLSFRNAPLLYTPLWKWNSHNLYSVHCVQSMLIESTAKTNCVWIMTSHWTNIIQWGDAAPFSTGNSICWNTEWQHEVTPVLNTFWSLNHFNSRSSFVPVRDDPQQLTFIIQNPVLNYSSNQKETCFKKTMAEQWKQQSMFLPIITETVRVLGLI